MAEVNPPGVYVEEIPAAKPIEGVSMTTAAFLGFAPGGPIGMPIQVDSWEVFCREFALAGAETCTSTPACAPAAIMYMPYAVRGFFGNGGKKAVVLRLDESCTDNAHYVQALRQIDAIPDVSMVITPETQDTQAMKAVLGWVTERRRSVYLLDAPAGMGSSELSRVAEEIGSDYGALYYPWLNVRGQNIPSAGHVAGIIARIDAERGVYKAPAGMPAQVAGITGISRSISASEADRLRAAHVNWIGSSRGSPIALQGARMLGESYLPVRRAIIYLERSLSLGLAQLTFEPSTPVTWAKAAQMSADFLHSEYVKGGFHGQNPAEAYFVKCDAETNTPSGVERGRILVLAGVALLKPAEFHVMRVEIQARTHTLRLSGDLRGKGTKGTR